MINITNFNDSLHKHWKVIGILNLLLHAETHCQLKEIETCFNYVKSTKIHPKTYRLEVHVAFHADMEETV